MTPDEIVIVTLQVQEWFQQENQPADVGNGFWYATISLAIPVKPFFGEYTGHEVEPFMYEYNRDLGVATITPIDPL